MAVKCIVKGCDNDSDHGHMVGNLCGPCHDFLVNGRNTNTQVFRNASDLFTRRFAEQLQSAAISMQHVRNAFEYMLKLLGERP